MTIEYSIVAAIVGAIYVIVLKFAPDFPVPPDMFLLIFLWVLAQLGVEVIGKPAAAKIRQQLALYHKQSKSKK